MIVLIAASAMYLAVSQAAVSAQTMSFKDCLKEASAKAKAEKVAANAYETYARNACGAQLQALTNALIAFETKNGVPRKSAIEDAGMTAGDYLASSVDKYQYMAGVESENTKAEAAAAAAKAAPALTPAPQATPAAVPQPPK